MSLNFALPTEDVETLKKKYTLSVLRKALIELNVRIWKQFTDPCDDEDVKALVAILKKDDSGLLVMGLAQYLRRQESSTKPNPFDVMTMVPSKVTTVTLGNEKVEFNDERDTEGLVPRISISNGCPGYTLKLKKDMVWDGAQVFTRVAMAGTSSVGAGEVKEKVPVNETLYSVPAEITKMGKLTLDELRGTPLEVARIYLDGVRKLDPTVRGKYFAAFDASAPLLGKLPVISLTKRTRQKWVPQYALHKMSVSSVRNVLMELGPVLTEKGQGKFANNAYLGIPMARSANYVIHKVTLDDAGVRPGMSIFVDTADVMMINFLRCNYGNKVVGKGLIYPMLPEYAYKNTSYDVIYVPTPVKISPGGNLSVVFSSLKADIRKKFNLPVKGSLVAYLTPLVFFDMTYEGTFFEREKGSKLECVPPTEKSMRSEEVAPVDRKLGVCYRASAVSNDVHDVWAPECIVDDSKTIVAIASAYRDEIGLTVKSLYLKLETKDAEYPRNELETLRECVESSRAAKQAYVRAIKKSMLDQQDTLSIMIESIPRKTESFLMSRDSFQNVEASISCSIMSWQGVVLYSELAPKVKASVAVNEVLSYMRFALRSLWTSEPYRLSNYSVNRIYKITGKSSEFGDYPGDMINEEAELQVNEKMDAEEEEDDYAEATGVTLEKIDDIDSDDDATYF